MRYLLLCWISFFFALPAWAASSASLEPLEHQLAQVISSKPGDVGIAAMDLDSGEWVSINGDVPFPMASTVKIAVAANYLAQVEYGRRSLDRMIAGRTAASLMEAMIVRSDNVATDLLLRDLGGPETIQAWFSQRRMAGLRMDRTIAQLLRARRDLRDIRDSSTPVAMVEFLRHIDNGSLLTGNSRRYLLGLMSRCATGATRIRALLPAGTRVENKTGTLNGLSADVGFITLPEGRRIAVAVFARGGTARPAAIAQTARAIYDGFRYSYSAAPAVVPSSGRSIRLSARTLRTASAAR